MGRCSEDIKNTFNRLGIPEAEQKWLGGVTAQYESKQYTIQFRRS